jgi:hypothetical protein
MPGELNSYVDDKRNEVEMRNYKWLINKKCPASLSLGEGTRVRPIL